MGKLFWITCKKATELAEKKQEQRLSGSETVKLKLHQLVCEACKVYEEQSRLMGAWIATKPPTLKPITEEEARALKERIIQQGGR